MSNKRKYLIFADWQQDHSCAPYFDACTQAILDGTARISKTRNEPGYPQYPCFRVQGREVLVGAVLEYYLYRLGAEGFDYEKARNFSEQMRRLAGFSFEVRYPLSQWVKRCLRNPYFQNVAREDSFYESWVLNPNEAHDFIPEDMFKFACYVAICHTKYDAGDSYTAQQIFEYVTALGSNIPAQLKKNGSGTLPKEVVAYKDAVLSCKANDAFATIKITMKEDTEQSYAQTLDFLCTLLEAEFPRSYSFDFRTPSKNVLPIKGLPKCGVHYLFAGAIRYPALYEKIERYARLAMREFEWYINLQDEKCAMPGTFAVFALGITNEKYHALVCDYLSVCDGEHQSLQGDFVLAYIEQYGFTEKGLELYRICEENIQHLPKKLMTLYKKNEKNNFTSHIYTTSADSVGGIY
ncbi:DUF6138 family protein [Bacteroides sp. 224]|uniref:DUF6138 family protein n=1 Tax=Bacteroides sp. 224 TaxID=2302936 RepID=UPI0013D728A1|nr:DUF6138 family protein [Bacteroides sp. 224]NDV66713.1 hypothetical protein [Bacteroides sp. 224]